MVISPCVIKTRLSVSCLGFGEQGPWLRECPRTELSEPRGSSPCTRLGLPAGTGVQNCWKKSFQPPSNIDEERSREGGERGGTGGWVFHLPGGLAASPTSVLCSPLWRWAQQECKGASLTFHSAFYFSCPGKKLGIPSLPSTSHPSTIF